MVRQGRGGLPPAELAIEEGIFGESDVRVSPTLEMLGEILYRERAYNEAGRLYGRGLALQQAVLGGSDPRTHGGGQAIPRAGEEGEADRGAVGGPRRVRLEMRRGGTLPTVAARMAR